MRRGDILDTLTVCAIVAIVLSLFVLLVLF